MICSCCGNAYTGKQSIEHDKGFGTCESCVREMQTNSMRELDRLIAKITQSLSPEKQETFLKQTIDDQRAYALNCLEQGLISYV